MTAPVGERLHRGVLVVPQLLARLVTVDSTGYDLAHTCKSAHCLQLKVGEPSVAAVVMA